MTIRQAVTVYITVLSDFKAWRHAPGSSESHCKQATVNGVKMTLDGNGMMEAVLHPSDRD